MDSSAVRRSYNKEAKLTEQRRKLAVAKRLVLDGATQAEAAAESGLGVTKVAEASSREGWALQRATAAEIALAESLDWRGERAVYRAQSYATAKRLLDAVELIPDTGERVESWRVVNREIRSILGMDSDGGGGSVNVAVFTGPAGR